MLFHDREDVSSEMHYYKRLLPPQLVRLREGADILLVLLPLPKDASQSEKLDYKAITKDINVVLLDSCHGSDQKQQLEQLLHTHKIKREGGIAISSNFV